MKTPLPKTAFTETFSENHFNSIKNEEKQRKIHPSSTFLRGSLWSLRESRDRRLTVLVKRGDFSV
jgi:hypothetical protein